MEGMVVGGETTTDFNDGIADEDFGVDFEVALVFDGIGFRYEGCCAKFRICKRRSNESSVTKRDNLNFARGEMGINQMKK